MIVRNQLWFSELRPLPDVINLTTIHQAIIIVITNTATEKKIHLEDKHWDRLEDPYQL